MSVSTLVFIGPAVRFYERDLVEPGDLLWKGHGFMNQLHEEEKVVWTYHLASPFSATQRVLPGYVKGVPPGDEHLNIGGIRLHSSVTFI
jgi:hypothetical protein